MEKSKTNKHNTKSSQTPPKLAQNIENKYIEERRMHTPCGTLDNMLEL